MSLPAREQQLLDAIETTLQASEAGLTQMYMLFTRLAAGEAKPRTEELGLPSRRSVLALPRAADGLPRDARLRSLAGGRRAPGGSREWLRVAVLFTMLIVALGSAVALTVRGTSTQACVPATAPYAPASAPSQPLSCPSSPSVPTPTRIPLGAQVR
jgi:hypothetical protein